MSFLPYDPGALPTKPALGAGDVVELEVDGYPPYKDESFSIRNPKHKDYERFVRLRKAGTEVMGGRAWSHGPIKMDFVLYAPGFERGKTLFDYVAGIEDTLDGSSGYTFTYLPIVFEDDCQVCAGGSKLVYSEKVKYKLRFEVLEEVLEIEIYHQKA